MNHEEGRLRKSPLSTDSEGRGGSDTRDTGDPVAPGGVTDPGPEGVARARQHYRPLDITHLLRRTG